jgi:L-ascorbate metabolism protein UlaG (beta-lactamase superfamily)
VALAVAGASSPDASTERKELPVSGRSSVLSALVLVLALGGLGTLAFATKAGPPALTAAPVAAAPASQSPGITVEYLGWSHYRLTSPSGKVVVTNPYIVGNPDAAITLDEAITLPTDLIVVADGHSDEMGQTVEIAKATGAPVIVPTGELRSWVEEKGVPAGQLVQANPGSFHVQDGIRIQVLHSIHSSGARSPGEPLYYGGVAGSYMITFENGYTVYFSGSSAATMDMQWWGEMYKPDMVIQHMSGNREPRDAAMAVKFLGQNNPNLKVVFPHHHRLQAQPGTARPADLRAAMQQMDLRQEFVEPDPLRPYNVSR